MPCATMNVYQVPCIFSIYPHPLAVLHRVATAVHYPVRIIQAVCIFTFLSSKSASTFCKHRQ